MKQTSVLLVYGGPSTEHQVSIRSASSIYQAIDQSKYQVQLCYIDEQGIWWLLDSWVDNGQPASVGVELVADVESGKFFAKDGGTELTPDVILPVLHGQFGEDGQVQTLAESMGIPIVGCDARSSKICWDKVLTKQSLESAGITTVPHVVYLSDQPSLSYDDLSSKLDQVMFVKPARSGSSIGVSRVASQEELDEAISLALEHDDKLLIEKAIVGRELEVGVLGNPPQHQVTGVGEIRPGEEFYSYDDKYDDQSTAEVIVSADLAPDLADKIQTIAHQAYAILGCRGLARVDFLLGNDGQVFVNEVNTFPGFTSISQYPKLWQAAGVEYQDLIDRLVESALEGQLV